MTVLRQSGTDVNLVLQFCGEVKVSETPLLIRPYLQVAALCEKQLMERDGAVSIIRIIDRFTVTGLDDSMPRTSLSFMLVVMFKAGNFRGRTDIAICPLTPSHIALPEISMSVQFDGDDERGVNMLGQVKLEVDEEGLYWLIVKLAKEEYTRIPLRVVYQKQPTIRTS